MLHCSPPNINAPVVRQLVGEALGVGPEVGVALGPQPPARERLPVREPAGAVIARDDERQLDHPPYGDTGGRGSACSAGDAARRSPPACRPPPAAARPRGRDLRPVRQRHVPVRRLHPGPPHVHVVRRRRIRRIPGPLRPAQEDAEMGVEGVLGAGGVPRVRGWRAAIRQDVKGLSLRHVL